MASAAFGMPWELLLKRMCHFLYLRNEVFGRKYGLGLLFRKGVLGMCFVPQYNAMEEAHVNIPYTDFSVQSSKAQAGSSLGLAAVEIQTS